MKLLFDIGNTSVHWAEHDGQSFRQRGTFTHKHADLLTMLEQQLSITTQPEAILVASVASDEQNNSLNNWLLKRFQVQPWHAAVGKECAGLINSYTDCQQMGIDRWLAMLAAWTEYKTALCVVDCGTALTIDCIDANGQHAGGYILPGMVLMQTGLLHNTDRIRAAVSESFSIERAMNTQDAISRGACLAMVAAIERAVADFQSTCSIAVQGVITGGNAKQVVNPLNKSFVIHDTLVLDGLLTLYEETT